MLANDKSDVSIKLPVTERVIVARDAEDNVRFGNPAKSQIPDDWIPNNA